MRPHEGVMTDETTGNGDKDDTDKGQPMIKGHDPEGAEDYGAGAIRVLEGLEAVRVRPAMYIGSTGEAGLHHLVYEVVDNSVDEALAGYCTEINVTIHIDNSVTVVDNGRGIPVGPAPDRAGHGHAEVVLTKLHAGGKFDKKAYKVSGGLHGVGISVVNALSETLEVEIWRDKKVYRQSYAARPAPGRRSRTRASPTAAAPRSPSSPTAASSRRPSSASTRCRSACASCRFLNRGIIITLEDEREDKKHRFQYEGGIASFVRAPEPQQGDAAAGADLDRRHARRRDGRGRAAVERRLRRERLLLREQHQHPRRRHPPGRLQERPHPHASTTTRPPPASPRTCRADRRARTPARA